MSNVLAILPTRKNNTQTSTFVYIHFVPFDLMNEFSSIVETASGGHKLIESIVISPARYSDDEQHSTPFAIIQISL